MKHSIMQTLTKKNKKATKHIVSWSSKEDDILREQIRVLGTDNWTIIASKFNNKTTRQCRRRWFTYLNSDYKKGGWSAEEDNLLCQAQKIFGNRWTQIAKVVSGRTDNAVKNRFSTLCKRRAKHEALAKENATPYVNLNNQRVVVSQVDTNANEMSETKVLLKKIRRDVSENVSDMIERPGEEFNETNEQLTPSLALIGQKVDILRDLETQASTDMLQEIYLGKDDPEIIALMQQAELLSSVAFELNIKNTQQTTDNASDICATQQNAGFDPEPNRPRQSNVNGDVEKHTVSCATTNQSGGMSSSNTMTPSDDLKADNEIVYDFSSNEFNFPLQVTPVFRSLVSGVPSPQFTESEREFLLKTLGVEPAGCIPDPKHNSSATSTMQRDASSKSLINT